MDILLCKSNLKLVKILWICVRSFVNSNPNLLSMLNYWNNKKMIVKQFKGNISLLKSDKLFLLCSIIDRSVKNIMAVWTEF